MSPSKKVRVKVPRIKKAKRMVTRSQMRTTTMSSRLKLRKTTKRIRSQIWRNSLEALIKKRKQT